MKCKRNQKGVAALIWILLAMVIVLTVLILSPFATEVKEYFLRSADRRQVKTAEDSAMMHYLTDGEMGAVYDTVHKRFVPLSEIQTVEGYGVSREHLDQVLYIECDENGKLSSVWMPTETEKNDALDNEKET